MEGYEGWDEYAPFYDWENARTLGRRDVPFWRRFALEAGGPVLELGAGTGRVAAPLGRAGVPLTGIDRSEAMLARARRRTARAGARRHVRLVRGDIRHLPFSSGAFAAVMAPYGVLQSLLRERDLAATLRSVHQVLQRGGAFGLELVADLPAWEEYRRRISLRGWKQGRDGARVTLPALGVYFMVLEVPGHTLGHISYYRPGVLFCGDTLFGAGCGRVFEGTMAQMHASLARLIDLPPETLVYCAHEYTQSCLRFAHTVEPDNAAIATRAADVAELRAAGQPSVPSTLAEELATNPFLRWNAPGVIAAATARLGHHPANDAETFAAIRIWRDNL